MPEDLYIAQELVDAKPTTVTYNGEEAPLEKGRLLLHAVSDTGETAPLCVLNARRVLATGWRWSDSVPGHLQRCSACAALAT